MKTLGITLTVLLTTILFLSSASAVWAQSGADTPYYPVDTSQIPQPSVPQFTVKLVDYSYDVPSKTVTTTDPYNGQTTTTIIQGYHVSDYKLEIKIINQPYPTKIGNWTFQLYYNVRMKGHYEEWSNSTYQFNGASQVYVHSYGQEGLAVNSLITSSTSEFTILNETARCRIGDKIDFQVQAIIANKQMTWNYDHIFPVPIAPIFAYSASPLSQIQTFTMPDTSSPNFNADKPTTQQTTTPTQPTPTQTTNPTTPTETTTDQISQVNTVFGFDSQNSVIAVMGIIIVVLLFALIILNKRKQATGKPEVL